MVPSLEVKEREEGKDLGRGETGRRVRLTALWVRDLFRVTNATDQAERVLQRKDSVHTIDCWAVHSTCM